MNPRNTFLNSILLTSLSISSVKGVGQMPEIPLIGKLLLTGAACAFAEQSKDSDIVKGVENIFNLSRGGVSKVLGLSSVCLLAANVPGADQRKWQIWATAAPIAAAIGGLVKRRFFTDIVSNIPALGKYVGKCENRNCVGSCNRCWTERDLTFAALYVPVSEGLHRIIQ